MNINREIYAWFEFTIKGGKNIMFHLTWGCEQLDKAGETQSVVRQVFILNLLINLPFMSIILFNEKI